MARPYDGDIGAPWPPDCVEADVDDDARACALDVCSALPLWHYEDRDLRSGRYRFFRYADDAGDHHAGASRLFGLGFTTPPGILGNGYDLYAKIPDQVQGEMSAVLSSYVSPAQAQMAVSQLSTLGSAAFGVLGDLSRGNLGKAVGDATPILAAALAATAANPLVGAAVLAGASILAAILPNLGRVQQCDYTVGDVCFRTRARPAGPNDPDWITIDDFDPIQNGNGNAGSFGNASWTAVEGTSLGIGGRWCDLAFPTWWHLVGLELYALGDRSIMALDWLNGTFTNPAGGGLAPDAMIQQYVHDYYLGPNAQLLSQLGDRGRQFLVAFDHAFVKLQEPQLNGFAPIPPGILVNAVTQAWNPGFVGPPFLTLPKSFAIDNGALGADHSKSATFVQWVLAGGLDQQAISTGIDLNMGARRVHVPPPTKPPPTPTGSTSSTSSSLSTGAKVGLGLAAVGGASWLALGRPLSVEAAKAGFRKLSRRVRR